MGLLQKGAWVDKWYDTEENQGEFKRHDSQIRHWGIGKIKRHFS